MVPFDGDLLHLFYNKEILDYYKFQPPRTWQEYNEIAEKVHGQVFPLTNKTLTGSCIGRTPQCAGAYWAVQVLASMTQSRGSSTGMLFDTKDMKPLTDDALMETLRIFEKQHKYGHPTEFDGCIDINMGPMSDEECVLTLNWGNSFAANVLPGKLGIAKVPGSQKVLNRETGKLDVCDIEKCPNAVYYEDIGFVNYAPYAAFGGWSGAVSLIVDCLFTQMSCFVIFLLIYLSSRSLLFRSMLMSPMRRKSWRWNYSPFRRVKKKARSWLCRKLDHERPRVGMILTKLAISM